MMNYASLYDCQRASCRLPQSSHRRKPYHQRIYSLCNTSPLLQHLDDYMNEGFHRIAPLGNPSSRVGILEIAGEKFVPRSTFTIDADLKEYLSQSGVNNHRSRLLLIEDISPELIEFLGSELEIDPFFFATHICSLNWFRGRSSPSTVSWARSLQKHQSFIQFQYVEARQVFGVHADDPSIQRYPAWDSYALRKITVARLASTQHAVGWARRNLTVWMKQSNSDNFIGIILVDPSVRFSPSTKLEWRGEVFRPELFLHRSDVTQEKPPSGPILNAPLPSLFQVILAKYSQPDTRASRDCFYTISHILPLIVAEWHNIAHISECELMNFDYARELDSSNAFSKLQTQLSSLRSWRRRFTKDIEFTEKCIALCQERGSSSWMKLPEDEHVSETISNLRDDFQELTDMFQKMKDYTEKEVNVVLGMISIETGKRSVVEAQRVTQLTITALIFLPLSFVASLLSMGGSFALDGERGWIYWAVAIPLSALVTFAGLYPRWSLRKKKLEVLLCKTNM
ncbi:hypothetical protein F5884DRAFT_308219 [Xylogone sp. PMI_703]|nr:hypothetical protein F5884DRAFT_308219 [Xylogone sp. PMI_703]